MIGKHSKICLIPVFLISQGGGHLLQYFAAVVLVIDVFVDVNHGDGRFGKIVDFL